MNLHVSSNSVLVESGLSSGQDVGGLVARPRLKVLGRRLRMHATEKTIKFYFLFC